MTRNYYLYTFTIAIFFLLVSCVGLGSKNLNSKTGYFRAGKREVITDKAIPVNADTLKKLLVVRPRFKHWTETAKKIGYFEQVLNREDFLKDVNDQWLSKLPEQSNDSINLAKVYRDYKPFTILYYDSIKTEDGKTYGVIRLYKPDTETVIFQSRARLYEMLDAGSYNGIYFELYNSLIAYLRAQR